MKNQIPAWPQRGIDAASSLEKSALFKANTTQKRGDTPHSKRCAVPEGGVKATLQLGRPTLWVLLIGLAATAGCGGRAAEKQHQDFFTSGSREADQRASQRMAKDEQLAGSGEGSGEKGVKKAKSNDGGTNTAAQATNKLALFDRLGGDKGITAIIEDFTPRVMQDPRVNWERKGIRRGGLSIHRDQSVSWNPSPENVAMLKKHLIQFISLATGGPAHYEGKEIKGVHADMHISNPEFDAALGDLKASLDRLKVPNKEQKELLSIIESTRPEIVVER
jgi:hemoglobin